MLWYIKMNVKIAALVILNISDAWILKENQSFTTVYNCGYSCVHGSCVVTDKCLYHNSKSNCIKKECECQPGWTGPYCDIPCPFKTFGLNCSQTCQCVHAISCDRANGSCECETGWTGNVCNNYFGNINDEYKILNAYTKNDFASDVGSINNESMIDDDDNNDTETFCGTVLITTNAVIIGQMLILFAVCCLFAAILCYTRKSFVISRRTLNLKQTVPPIALSRPLEGVPLLQNS